MKVLFISHFREGSDWSDKAAEYAFSMIEAGIDLVIRNINLSASSREAPLPLQLSQLEKKENKDCIIASIDKDFGTIPGSHFNWSKDIGVTSVDEKEADYNFYLQVLTGDATDGYAGCPGIGPKRAERLLEDTYD